MGEFGPSLDSVSSAYTLLLIQIKLCLENLSWLHLLIYIYFILCGAIRLKLGRLKGKVESQVVEVRKKIVDSEDSSEVLKDTKSQLSNEEKLSLAQKLALAEMTHKNFTFWFKTADCQTKFGIFLLSTYVVNLWQNNYPRNENSSNTGFWAVNVSFVVLEILWGIINVAQLKSGSIKSGSDNLSQTNNRVQRETVTGNSSSKASTVSTATSNSSVNNVEAKKNINAKSESMTNQSEFNFLSRDQTNELKGWMQVFIIAYHYFRSGPIVYNWIRVMVSAYLFLTGFGNWIYFRGAVKGTGPNNSFTVDWSRFSLRRITQVLLRVNLLAILLIVVCRVDGNLFYTCHLHFVCFWMCYATAYLTIKAGEMKMTFIKNSTSETLSRNLILSIVVCLHICIHEIVVPNLMENHIEPTLNYYKKHDMINSVLQDNTIDWPPSGFSMLHWPYFLKELREILFRIQLDRYTGLFGLLFAEFVYSPIKKMCTTVDSSDHNKSNFLLNPSNAFSVYFPILGSILCFLYCWFFVGENRKTVYNTKVHPYFGWMPIIGYILLRNTTLFKGSFDLKKYYAPMFAKIGTWSMELFLLQWYLTKLVILEIFLESLCQ